jgi:hypothetical protein
MPKLHKNNEQMSTNYQVSPKVQRLIDRKKGKFMLVQNQI